MPEAFSSCPYCAARNLPSAGYCQMCGATLESAVALPAGLVLGGRFRIEHVWGRGGFGITYRATDLSAGQALTVGVSHAIEEVVAVKELFPDGVVTRQSDGMVLPKAGLETEFAWFERRFYVEAQTLTRLQHPATTHFIAAWQECGTAYLAMEFVQGETLETRLKHSRLSEREARLALTSILELLTEVHALDLLHRDIKPANIVLQIGGAQLIDFGSVIAFTPGAPTHVTSRLLTPQYAPLELYGSNVHLSPSSDLYSLAASFYEALSGVTPPSALERVGGADLQPLEALMPSLDLALARALDSALALRVAERPQSAALMVQMLRDPQLRAVSAMQVPIAAPSSQPVASPSEDLEYSYVVFFGLTILGTVIHCAAWGVPWLGIVFLAMLVPLAAIFVATLLTWQKGSLDEMLFETISSYTIAAMLLWPAVRDYVFFGSIFIALSGFGGTWLLALLHKNHSSSPLERSLWALLAAFVLIVAPALIARQY